MLIWSDPGKKEVFDSFENSNLACLTNVIEHDITDPGFWVNIKAHRIPEAGYEIVPAELKSMLDLGIIEESSSSCPSHMEPGASVMIFIG